MSNYFRTLKRLNDEKVGRPQTGTTARVVEIRNGVEARQGAGVKPAPNDEEGSSAASPGGIATPPVGPATRIATGDSASSHSNAPALDSTRSGGPASARKSAGTAQAPATAQRGRPRSTIPTAPLHGADGLLDTLRAHCGARRSKTFVLAGAVPTSTATAVAASIAAQADLRGLTVLRAEVRHPIGRIVHVHLIPPASRAQKQPTEDSYALQIDLNDASAQEDLQRWRDELASNVDLMLIEGPPLSQTLDAALFARACDGLIIVVDTSVTDRVALAAAAERARVARCATVGVVVNVTKNRLPRWLNRFLSPAHQFEKVGF